MLTIPIMNLVLCIIIIVLSLWAYQKTQNFTPLFLAVAFALFGLSHIARIFGFEANNADFFVIVRTFGYICVILGLFKMVVDA